MLRGYTSPKDLLDKQTDEELKKLSPEIILTLTGIKLLKTYFKDNIKESRFVIAKAMQQVKAACGGSGTSIDAMCDKLNIDVAF